MKNFWIYVILGCLCLSGVRSQSFCVTPNGEQASCTELRSCPILNQAYLDGDQTVQQFLTASASACSAVQNKVFPVCCGSSAHFANADKAQVRDLVPSKTYCGLQHADDYFHNDNETNVSVDEFPWLLPVYHGDRRRNKREETGYYPAGLIAPARLEMVLAVPTSNCLGVLINRRYVLTAASCATEEKMWVALGQYDQTRNVSCTKTQYGDDCTDPVINVTVTEQIPSPKNDILLLRLENVVTYTDYVRPICLPLEESEMPKYRDTVTTSGWGRSFTTKDVSKIVKKKNEQNVSILRDCSDSRSDICLLQKDDGYTCTADRGGPMMLQSVKFNWFVVGIVDYIADCSYFTVPGKKLTAELVEWILATLRE